MADGTLSIADGLGIKVVDSIQVHKKRQQPQPKHFQQSNMYPQRHSGVDYTTPMKFTPSKNPNPHPPITMDPSTHNPKSEDSAKPKSPQH